MVKQTLNGITSSQLQSTVIRRLKRISIENVDANTPALRLFIKSVTDCVTGLSNKSITISSIDSISGLLPMSLVTYIITVNILKHNLTAIAIELEMCVSSGNFTYYLQSNAVGNNVPSMISVDSGSTISVLIVNTSPPTNSPIGKGSNANNQYDLLIGSLPMNLLAAVGGFLIILCTCCCYCYRGYMCTRTKKQRISLNNSNTTQNILEGSVDPRYFNTPNVSYTFNRPVLPYSNDESSMLSLPFAQYSEKHITSYSNSAALSLIHQAKDKSTLQLIHRAVK